MDAGISLPPPGAAILDWDDTIVDTWRVVCGAFNATLRAFGVAEWSEEEARARIGPPAREIFTGLFGADRWREADAIYLQAYADNVGELVAHDGAEEMLRLLAAKMHFVALVSSKRADVLRREAAHLGFDGYFNRIIGAGDAAVSKPDPAVVALALEGSGVAPGPGVWFIGDSVTDMCCARAAGCTPILIGAGPPGARALAGCLPAARFATPRDLLSYAGSPAGPWPHN